MRALKTFPRQRVVIGVTLAALAATVLTDSAFMSAYALFFTGVALLVARGQAGRLQSAGFWRSPRPRGSP